MTASLPTGALSIYEAGGRTSVFAVDFGAGRVGGIGWDWFRAAPLGSDDGGWLNVLDAMVNYTAPTANTLAIQSGGSATLGAIFAGFGARGKISER